MKRECRVRGQVVRRKKKEEEKEGGGEKTWTERSSWLNRGGGIKYMSTDEQEGSQQRFGHDTGERASYETIRFTRIEGIWVPATFLTLLSQQSVPAARNTMGEPSHSPFGPRALQQPLSGRI